MAGIGDSWGTREELLHPRDAKGRFRTKWKMSPAVLAAVEKVLSAFRPRTFQSDSQAAQFLFNESSAKKPGRFGGGDGFARLQADYNAADEDLRDGIIDEPSTKKFIQMMDEAAIPIPNDLIISRVVGPDAFGLPPERIHEIEEMTGNVIADRGYGAANIGTPIGGGQGMITMVMATPAGTKMVIPGRNRNDRAVFYDRDQEFTVSKIKPDGRGGYTMYAVATPKTPGETPPIKGVGPQGEGTSFDREEAVRRLQEMGDNRVRGDQPADQISGQPQPQVEGQTPGVAPPVEDATARATRRAQILGRPAGPNATPEAQREAAAPPAPAPTPAVEAPANVPEAPTGVTPPPGATSVVTGEPATSFRDAVSGANLEAPSAGPRRREWNSAYQGIASGKQQPGDMLRELESDIANNKLQQKTETGRGDAVLAKDIEDQEKLADLIRSHFNLGEPKQRQARQEVRADLERAAASKAQKAMLRKPGGTEKAPAGKKTAVEAARPGPLAKVAPPRKDTPAERAKALTEAPVRDQTDDELNAAQRERWSDLAGGEPAVMKKNDTAGNILLDEVADLLRNGRITRPKASARLRDQARDDQGPEADYLRKVADAIDADTSAPAKRVPVKKAAKAAPDVDAATKKLEGRTDRNILTGLNGLSVGELRALADKWDVQTRGDDKKLKLKSALAKELAAKWKATPELQGKKEGAPEAPVKKAAKAAVKAAVPQTDRQIRAARRREEAARPLTPEQKQATQDAAKLAGDLDARNKREQDAWDKAANDTLTSWSEAAGRPMPEASEVNRTGLMLVAGSLASKKISRPEASRRLASVAELHKDDFGDWLRSVVLHLDQKAPRKSQSKAAVLERIAAEPDTPAVIKKAAAKAAKAAVPGASPGTAAPQKKTVSTSRLQVGERIWVRQDAEGNWLPTTVKGGSVPIEVTDISRGEQMGRSRSYLVSGRDADGNMIGPAAVTGQNVFMRDAPTPAKVAPVKALDDIAPVKKAAKKAVSVAEVREEVEATRGPAKVSVEDRVAAHLLARMPDDMRDRVLADMPEKDRNTVLETAQRVADEKTRVKSDGIDLDRLQEEAGVTVPDNNRDKVLYERYRRDLTRGKADSVRDSVKQELTNTNRQLKQFQADADNPNLLPSAREPAQQLVREVTERRDWLQAIQNKLNPKSPDRTPEVIHVQAPKELVDATPDQLREAAKLGGIEVSEGATTRDEVATDIIREMARRRLAGEPIEGPAAVKKVAKKAAPAAGPVDDTVARLEKVITSEAGMEELKNIRLKSQLRDIADRVGYEVKPKDTSEQIRQGILRQAVTGRLEHGTLQRLGTGEPSIGDVLERAAKEVAAPPEVKRLTATQVRRLSPEDVETAFNEGRVTKAPALRHLEDIITNTRENAAIRGGGGNAMRTGAGNTPENLAAAERFRAEADRYEAIANRIKAATPPKVTVAKAVKKAAPAAPTVPPAVKKVAAPAGTGKLSANAVRGMTPEAVEAAFNEGRVGKTPAIRQIQEAAQNLRDNATIRDGISDGAINPTGRVAPENAAAGARLRAEADQLDEMVKRIQGAPTKRAAKQAVPAKKASTALTSNLSSFSEPELRGISRNRSLGAPQREAAEAELERRGLSVSEPVPAKKVTKKAAKAAVEKVSEDATVRDLQVLQRGGFRDSEPSPAKKAAEAAVEARRVRSEVADEMATQNRLREAMAEARAAAPAKATKKAAKKAAPGKHTREELMDGPLSDIVDLEQELGLQRPSLDRGDRVDAILNAEAAAAPVKKAAKKAAAAAPGKPVARKHVPYNAGGNGLQRVERANADEPLYLPNGGADQGAIHMDSDIGQLWQELVMDDRSTNSFVNEIARMGDQMGQDKLGLDDFLDRLRDMKKRAPDSAIADRIQETIDNLDAPKRKPDIPGGAPPALRRAMEELAAIPTARKKATKGKGRERIGSMMLPDESVLEKKEKILRDLVEGDGQVSFGDVENRLGNHDYHESVDAATTMWRIMDRAVNNKEVQAWIRQKLKEARARAT